MAAAQPDIDFQTVVWSYYRTHARDLPWRLPEADGSFDPYKILVSEIMLQQTQAGRVVPKYRSFLKQFPTIRDLACASVGSVVREWSGLGYNRRALYLSESARAIVARHNGVVPSTQAALVALPGVGANTAAAIRAYAYNQPTVFVETNIRTVYLYHFFNAEITRGEQVDDTLLLPIIQRTLTIENPREWYWALMDYGVMLKANVGNIARASKHYVKQSAFEGSMRQLRGRVLRELIDGPRSLGDLGMATEDSRIEQVLKVMQNERLIWLKDGLYSL